MMNALAHLTYRRESVDDALMYKSHDTLLSELDQYRRRSERLQRINDLHSRLAGVVDLTSMIEAYSIWLSPAVPHELIAYREVGERDRIHMFCSSHGPDRRKRMEASKHALKCFTEHDDINVFIEGGFHVRSWQIPLDKGKAFLLLMRLDRDYESDETQIIDETLGILNDSLLRALGYEDLFMQARLDILTGLANRRVFEERIDPIMDIASRHSHPLTLASMDLDRFKKINDTLGHAAGDKALKKVAQVLASMIRSSDLLVRFGGDEFILVLPETGIEDAKLLADRLCLAVEELNISVPGAGKLGISIGLVQWRENVVRDELLQKADEALYRAKAAGRSRVCLG